MLSLRRKAVLYAKNTLGNTTSRKLVAFGVDDYGNVMLHSKTAREQLRKAGLDIDANRFTQYDALENADDLHALYETLASVRDQRGRAAVFTAFALPTNLDFEAIEANGHTAYAYELLPDTLAKLPGYEGTWAAWQTGMREGLLVPEFHGREHLNLRLFEHWLERRDAQLMACLAERSYVAIRTPEGSRVGYTEAFSFDSFAETERHRSILADGFALFEQVFDRKARHFNAPGAREHECLHDTIRDAGIRWLDTDIVKNEHQGNGIFKKKYYRLGQKNALGQRFLYRNCVFEPTLDPHCVDHCLAEIDIAFACQKPAHISSHRVNFQGRIDPAVRDLGLANLKQLLQAIVKKWPDVEFVSTAEMGEILVGET
jgi:hypothetical protein